MDFTNIMGGGDDPFDQTEHAELSLFQQGRKSKTHISGLKGDTASLNPLLKTLKKEICNCNGSIEKRDDQLVIVLFGDQREKVRIFLRGRGISVTVHGA